MSTSADLTLDLHDVEKVYRTGLFSRRSVHALRGVSMQVHRGEIFGLLGPNGAGKSTLVKILMTVIRASRCKGTMLGHAIGDKASLRRVGYLPEHHRFPEYLSAWQVLDYFGALSDIPRATRKKRGGELLELVGLGNWRNHKVKGFSKGMRQRLGIANALIMDPELVVLDEPTDGVDPVGRRDIRQVLVQLRDQGRTVLLNSHLLSELEMVSDRVAIMVQGRMVAQGTIDALTADSRRYQIEVEDAASSAPGQTALIQSLQGRIAIDAASGAGSISVHGGETTIPLRVTGNMVLVDSQDPRTIQPVIDLLRASNLTIKSVMPLRSSLEDLFMQAVTDPSTGKALRPGAKSD